MCIVKVEEMRNVDVTKVDIQDLVDNVRQIKNPYCYKYGDYVVKISFEDTAVTLTERLKELMLKTANIQ